MKIVVDRFTSTKEETLGRLFIDGRQYCYTLEDEKRDIKVHGETRIPVGVYKLGLRNSPHFSPKTGHDMLWVKDVPGFNYILIHSGNTDKDTEGCLLVGSIFEKKNERITILRSKEAYNLIYPIISEAVKKGEVTIEYRDFDSKLI
jgi:hypothetical protein